MPFNDELEFERKFIEFMTQECGWEKEVIQHPTEEDLIKNWSEILFNNNKKQDTLNNQPLTEGEMNQIITQVNQLRTPVALNNFINGKTVSIVRDNPDDELHFGKPVSLKIYDREEIAGGMSRYQIAEQPHFKTNNSVYPARRGDVMLLINGMPVFHIELKKTGIPLSQAEVQIEKYMVNGCFIGVFSLVQIFVAMNPEDAVYFANPGPNGKFNPDFYFHWEDFNNVEIHDWDKFTKTVLSIPRAHELIGYYTIPDDTDGVLKVMRSYQFFATSNIADRVARTQWTKAEQRGGFIWHTTGSGKTMTSFKAAQLIANSRDADKVVFLIDRVELGDQSLINYRNFANPDETVQSTEDTKELISKLVSDSTENTLIVTSIQKMSRINDDSDVNLNDLNKIKAKRIVFIIDECHRDQKGEMHLSIKKTFPNAIYFGFTGTPDKGYTTDIFGDELHRYTIAHGIRDGNVLGFDPYRCPTYPDDDLKTRVCLNEVNCGSVEEVYEKGGAVKDKFESLQKDLTMLDVENKVDVESYQTKEHVQAVVSNILNKWAIRSSGSLFHAIFATSSIPEAITYYYEFKKQKPDFPVTAVFDPSDNNSGTSISKMQGITDILEDYNETYKKTFNISTYASFKRDVCARLSHKKPYINLKPEDKLNIVIVVDQLLTGFDSKWINTLYLDKVLEGKNLIQAISRTNRLFGNSKPHGTICFYRYSNKMIENLGQAMLDYSGGERLSVFVNKLYRNLDNMNKQFASIKDLFEEEDIEDFQRNADDLAWRKEFAKQFASFNKYLNSARIQGFTWDKLHYEPDELDGYPAIDVIINEIIYLTLVERYKDLFSGGGGRNPGVPIDVDVSITNIKTDSINNDYIDKKFKLFIKELNNGDPKVKEKVLKELHNSFASLPQDEQKFANIILHDIENGNLTIGQNKTFRDYLTDYILKAYNDKIRSFAGSLGINETQLRTLLDAHPSDDDLNSYGRYDALISTLDIEKAKEFYENLYGKEFTKREAKIQADKDLRRFILEGGYYLDEEEQ